MDLPSLRGIRKQDDLLGGRVHHPELPSGEVLDPLQGAELADLDPERVPLLNESALRRPQPRDLVAEAHHLNVLPDIEKETEEQGYPPEQRDLELPGHPPPFPPAPAAQGEILLEG